MIKYKNKTDIMPHQSQAQSTQQIQLLVNRLV